MTVRLQHSWIDDRDAPLYLWTTPRAPTDLEVETFCAALHAWLPQLDAPYAMIVDGRHLLVAKAAQRKLLADTLTTLAPHINRWCAGNAIIVTSSLARGVVTAIQWIARPTYAYELLATEEGARAWALKRLRHFDPEGRTQLRAAQAGR